METLFSEQPLSHNHQTTQEPENAAGSKPHLLYKCLLSQHTQKLRSPPPIYHTHSEGYDHSPRFRSTVWLDGVSYTSSSTFQQRKMAEMDASRVAYIAITQKAKTEALDFIREDKIFCKAIMSDFAAKKNIGKPIYKTTHLEGSAPVFHSSLFFNGVTYPGNNGKSKKEAEQLVARCAIIKFLDSEDGNDMAVLVNCKLRQYREMNKVQEIDGVQNGSNVFRAQTGVGHDFTLTEVGTSTMANSSATLESGLVQCTMVPATSLSTGLPQPIIQQPSVEPVIPVVPFVAQPLTPQVSTVPVVPELAAEPLVLTRIQSVGVSSPCAPVASAPSVEIPATDLSSGVTKQPKLEALPHQALEYIPLLGEASNKRRNGKNKKKPRKKMRVDARMPAELLIRPNMLMMGLAAVPSRMLLG